MPLEDEDIRQAVAADVGVVEMETFEEQVNNFRLLATNAIPIPPTIGDRFKDMFEKGQRALQARHKEWKRNIDDFLKYDISDIAYAYENLIRNSVETLIDFTYMRNPTIEMSADNEETKPLADLLQTVVTILMNKRTAPGLNLKPKVLRQMIYAHLTNFGIIELTYQGEKGSTQQALALMEQVRERIKEEEDADRAKTLYGLLDVLHRELDVRQSTGIGIRVRSPFSVIVDPKCEDLDFSTARQIMVRDVMDIDHIKAEYMNYDEEEKSYRFKYDENVSFDASSSLSTHPTVNVKEATEQEIMNDLMPDVDPEQAKLRAENTMPIVWVFDKTTRMKYLYIEGRWDTPLWVFEDEMKLSRFYPLFALAFSSPLSTIVQPGEVAHYRGFQSEINKINAEVKKVRDTAFSTYLYNADKIKRDEVTKVFNELNKQDQTGIKAIGVKMSDSDASIDEIMAPLKLPSTQFKEIFDKTDLKDALNRTTRISESLRGSQFRTNTTNKAVESYNQSANTRLDGLTDKIEDCVESIIWAICELVVSKYSPAEIAALLPNQDTSAFRTMSVEEFNRGYNMVVAAGSIEKPNTAAKKEEAGQIIQMLGQFGKAAPGTVLRIVTRVLRATFSRSMVTDKDLEQLEKESAAALEKGISTEQGAQNNVG